MSGYGYDENDDLDFGQPAEPQGGKGLRAQLEAVLAANKELKAQNEQIQKQMRAATVSNTLRDLGIGNVDKVAKLVPADAADDSDKVKAWVEEFKDVLGFGNPVTEAPAVEQEAVADAPAVPNLSAETLAAYQRLGIVDATSGTSAPEADSVAASRLISMHQAASGNPDAFFASLRGAQ